MAVRLEERKQIRERVRVGFIGLGDLDDGKECWGCVSVQDFQEADIKTEWEMQEMY